MFTQRDEQPSASGLDARTVERRLRRRAEAIERDELEAAFSALDARRELTTAERERLERLADDIVDGILAPPEAALERAADRDDETARAVAELFDLDAPSN
ncbi:hypothetical protein [Natrinema amylolyticum]|uniref:hypothetical protein n=1 Tax=Natrinema amylolyticum TaxID=2878679 RepID=UPI001CFBA61F|nr:hypothetical protein [Natrinema amylolyticum]